LYENFLLDSNEYAAAEEHWRQLVTKVAASSGQSGEWVPWIPRHHPNGRAIERDGNPIYDGRSFRLNRAFRIIQHERSKDQLEFAAWLKAYEEEFTDLPRQELVISLSLSSESSNLAQIVLAEWMAPATTNESMQSFIDKTVPRDADEGSSQT